MPKNRRPILPPTKPSVEKLRADSHNALLALHGTDPIVTRAHAAMLSQLASAHRKSSALHPKLCDECLTKQHLASLLRCIADLREIEDQALAAAQSH